MNSKSAAFSIIIIIVTIIGTVGIARYILVCREFYGEDSAFNIQNEIDIINENNEKWKQIKLEEMDWAVRKKLIEAREISLVQMDNWGEFVTSLSQVNNVRTITFDPKTRVAWYEIGVVIFCHY